MSSTQLYTVPVIAGDLRRVELIKQFADTFDYLDFVSQDILNRIAIRLNVYRAQLNKFDERIQHANAHIDRTKDSECAIQVHSSARYPVEQNRSTFKSIFEYNTDNKPSVFSDDLFHLNDTVDKFMGSTDKDSKSNDGTLIVLKQYEENFIQKTKRSDFNSLGRLPTNIKSVISFLKHNTQENPYIQATQIDTLNAGARIRKQVDEPIQSRFLEMSLPPFNEQMPERPVMDDFNYNPKLRLVPKLSVPDNLPELNNYATFVDNTVIDWTKQQMVSIAPSFVSILPDINDLSSTTITAPSVKSPKPTVAALPSIDIPIIIPLSSDSTSISAQPSSPAPVFAPPFLPTAPSVSIPPTIIDESQATPINTVDDGNHGSGNSLSLQILNFAETNKLKPVKKFNAPPLPSSNIMDNFEIVLKKRRASVRPDTFIDAITAKAKEKADELRWRKDDSDDDDDDNDNSDWSQ